MPVVPSLQYQNMMVYFVSTHYQSRLYTWGPADTPSFSLSICWLRQSSHLGMPQTSTRLNHYKCINIGNIFHWFVYFWGFRMSCYLPVLVIFDSFILLNMGRLLSASMEQYFLMLGKYSDTEHSLVPSRGLLEIPNNINFTVLRVQLYAYYCLTIGCLFMTNRVVCFLIPRWFPDSLMITGITLKSTPPPTY